MIALIEIALLIALVCALVAVVFGEVLTRSIVAGYAAIGAFGLAALAAGGGVVALCGVIVGLLSFALVQLFGWMLVDVDHDHLPAPALRRRLAQSAALGLVAAGLAFLAHRAFRAGELVRPAVRGGGEAIGFDPVALGRFFFGANGELALLLGCLLAGALLTALSLLRDEGADAG
jgi:hypothetical protein